MSTILLESVVTKAKPFLKWAGGKSQLLEQMTAYFPQDLIAGNMNRYAEPFVGSGAAFFRIAQTYQIQRYFISDINRELIAAYITIREDVEALIELLSEMQMEYVALSPEKQSAKFYHVREQFNRNLPKMDFGKFTESWIERTAQIIFLNRTCFNGLFRVNSRSEFNVPFGRYKNPLICASSNLRAVSRVLQQTEIQCGDFTLCEHFVDDNTFVYFDPPYRPISRTSSFTSYSDYDFDESAQNRLAAFYRYLDQKKHAKLMLSNSDPKNQNPHDHFFEENYELYRIARVRANRMINCDATKRGKIFELLIVNYMG